VQQGERQAAPLREHSPFAALRTLVGSEHAERALGWLDAHLREGKSIKQIAAEEGLDRKTVTTHLDLAARVLYDHDLGEARADRKLKAAVGTGEMCPDPNHTGSCPEECLWRQKYLRRVGDPDATHPLTVARERRSRVSWQEIEETLAPNLPARATVAATRPPSAHPDAGLAEEEPGAGVMFDREAKAVASADPGRDVDHD
jgi:hypothetical protein